MADRPVDAATAEREIARLRRRIDTLDRRIVALLNERAELGREIGRAKVDAGRRVVRDPEREREVLLRVAMANGGPMPQGDLLAIYRRVIAATRILEKVDGAGAAADGAGAASDGRGAAADGTADRSRPDGDPASG